MILSIKNRIKEAILKQFVLICIWIAFSAAYTCRVAAEENEQSVLNVSIVGASGSTFMTTGEGVLYLKENVKITPVTDEDLMSDLFSSAADKSTADEFTTDESNLYEVSVRDYFRISSTKEEALSEYVLLDEESVALNHDAYLEGEIYTLSLRREILLTCNEEEREHIIISARDLYFCFDLTPPSLEELSDISWDTWVNFPRGCDFASYDAISGVGRIIVKQDDDVIYEKHEDFEQECDFSIELCKEAQDALGVCLAVELSDVAGNVSFFEYHYFYDATAPSVVLEGVTNASMYNRDVGLSLNALDTIMSTTFLKYTIRRLYMDEDSVIRNTNIGEKDGGIFAGEVLSEDGNYVIEAKAYDLAGNESQRLDLSFRIDKSAPILSISGFESGHDYNKPLSSYFSITDGFPTDTLFSYEIYRSWPTGSEQFAQFETYLSGYTDNYDRYLNIDGDYHIICRAVDACGNESSQEAFLRVDTTAPKVSIGGIQNGTAIRDAPSISIASSELFYESTDIIVMLYLKNANGSFECVNSYVNDMKAENDVYTFKVDKEGSYLLNVTAIDRCGNKSVAGLEFILDYTPPQISWLDDINRKYFKKLMIPGNLKAYILDATGVRMTASLNSDVISAGEEITGEGKYVLTIVAVDDAGNESSGTAQFIIDKTAPRLIVSGLTREGAATNGGSISLSLYDEGDWFTGISFDGKEVALSDNQSVWSISPDTTVDHVIEVAAVDMAGNEMNKELVISKASFVNMDAAYNALKTITMGSDEVNTANINKNESKKYLYIVIPFILGICGIIILIFRRLRCIDTDK